MFKKHRMKTVLIAIFATLVLASSGFFTSVSAAENPEDYKTAARETIQKGVSWLKDNQWEDGSWSGDIAITSFAFILLHTCENLIEA